MDRLSTIDRRKQLAFVETNSSRSSRSRLDEIRDDTRVIQVPVPQWDFCFPSSAVGLPPGTGLLVFVSVVAVFDDIVDPHSAVAVVIVVRLPQPAERVDSHFPVVTEVPGERFEVGPIEVTAKDHALLVRLASVFDDVALLVDNRLSVLVADLLSGISKIEVELAIRTKDERMNSMVVLSPGDPGEHQLVAIGFEVAVVIVEVPDLVPD